RFDLFQYLFNGGSLVTQRRAAQYESIGYESGRIARWRVGIRSLGVVLMLVFGTLFMSSAPAAQAPEKAAGPASYTALADLLEDEAARDRLIAQLRGLAEVSGQTGAPAHATTPSTGVGSDTSLPARIAD